MEGREGNGPVTCSCASRASYNVLALPDVHAISIFEILDCSEMCILSWWRRTGAFLGKDEGGTVGNMRPDAVMRKGGEGVDECG